MSWRNFHSCLWTTMALDYIFSFVDTREENRIYIWNVYKCHHIFVRNINEYITEDILNYDGQYYLTVLSNVSLLITLNMNYLKYHFYLIFSLFIEFYSYPFVCIWFSNVIITTGALYVPNYYKLFIFSLPVYILIFLLFFASNS